MATTTSEERVRTRLDREIEAAQRDLDSAEQTVHRTDKEYQSAADAETELWEQLDAAPDDDKRAKIMPDHQKALNRRDRAFQSAQQALGAAATAKRQLDALRKPHEVERRVAREETFVDLRRRTDEKIAAGDITKPVRGKRGMSVRAAAEAVLKEHGKPMHSREITKKAIDGGLWKTKGLTPEATINAALAVSAKKGETFIKVAPSVYGLQEWS
jgi:hypothetical protein